MSARKTGSPLYGIGGVTLLTVLLILCLTLFAVLALSSAQADHRLSVKSATAVTAYYESENQVLETLGKIEEMWPPGAGRPSVSEISAGLSLAFAFTVENEDDGLLVTAAMPVMETQTLQVLAHLGPPVSGSRWDIRKWQLIPPEQDEKDIANLPLLIPRTFYGN